MTGPCPKFVDSDFFVEEFNNWHLKEGAPQEVVEEFEAWQATRKAWYGDLID